MSKKVIAYCGFDDQSRSGYLKWNREYLGLTDAQKLEFLADTINELIAEHRFLMRVIGNLKTASRGLELPQ